MGSASCEKAGERSPAGPPFSRTQFFLSILYVVMMTALVSMSGGQMYEYQNIDWVKGLAARPYE